MDRPYVYYYSIYSLHSYGSGSQGTAVARLDCSRIRYIQLSTYYHVVVWTTAVVWAPL
jgi:hypothetical protein